LGFGLLGREFGLSTGGLLVHGFVQTGWTAAQFAAWKGQDACLRILVDAGASVDMQNEVWAMFRIVLHLCGFPCSICIGNVYDQTYTVTICTPTCIAYKSNCAGVSICIMMGI
jgi:hypothetical protein